MKTTPKFSIVSRGTSKPLTSTATTDKGFSDFIKKTLSHLKQGEWLVMDIEEDYPWSIVLDLQNVSFSKSTQLSELEDLFTFASATGLSDEGLAPFEFEYSRLALRVSGSSYFPSLSILSRFRDSLFLACGREGVHKNGVVVWGQLASYDYYLDDTGGGGMLCRVSPKTAFSIGTGDSEADPEDFIWESQADLNDADADSVAYWLQENRLAIAFAWNRVKPSPSYFSEAEIKLFERIIRDIPLALHLNFDAHELHLIEEYLPKYSPLFLRLKNSLERRVDPLLWEIFMHHGLSGTLGDGGSALEDDFRVFSAAQRSIEDFYLLPKPFRGLLPDVSETRELISKLRRLELLEESEIERILAQNEDRLLRIAPGRLRKTLGPEASLRDCLQVLLIAFNDWMLWQEKKSNLSELIEDALA